MNNKSKNLFCILFRYLTVCLLGFGNLFLFYALLTPITIFVFYHLMSIFVSASLVGNGILIGNFVVEIVKPCVAAAGYYLLFILGMTTKMKPSSRLKSISTAFGIFFGFNIIRLIVLSFFLGSSSFETVHWIFWHFVSTVFVVGTWFIVVKIYKIKEIPFYSDMKYLQKLKNKNSKGKK